MTSQALRFCSYNCRGWRSGSDFVHSILPRCDFCLIQEHWLLSEHLGSLNIPDDFLSWGISGMDSCEFLHGRPFGGCGILYRESFANDVTRINCSSKRFCALSINLPNIPNNSMFSLLLVCVYMPADYNSPEATAAFLEPLCDLDGFILSESFDNIIIARDFNADFTRKSSNGNHLLHFMHNHNLVSVDSSANIT